MKIVIAGAGKMGAWFSDSLCLDHEVAIYDIKPEKLKYLFRVQRFLSAEEIRDFQPDLLINAVSLQHTIKLFTELNEYLPEECIISDIASVKNGMIAYYKQAGRRFVSTHPMFGPTFANIKELEKQNAIIIKESDEEGKKFFRNFYQSFGINLYEYEFEEHDQTIAYSLTTPFTSTLVFASCMKMQDAPGTTFKKHMQIAQGLLSEDEYLLSEIMFNKYSLPQIEKIHKALDHVLEILKSKDAEKFREYIRALKEDFV